MTAEHQPEFVYRLATADEWREANNTGVVPKRTIDERDGYFHLSTREQVLETANLHFNGVADLLALEIALAPIAAQVKFELAAKRGDAFPHLYDLLKCRHVTAVHRLVEDGDGFQFGEAL